MNSFSQFIIEAKRPDSSSLSVNIRAVTETVSFSLTIGTQESSSSFAKVLSAAAMTYVAALAVSLLQILRLVILSNNRRR